MIDLKDVSKAYPNGVHALNHVNLHIDKGEFVYVIGATWFRKVNIDQSVKWRNCSR